MATLGEKLVSLLWGIEEKKKSMEKKAIESFDELVDRLTEIELGSSDRVPSADSVDAILKASGKSVEDLQREILKRKAIDEKSRIVLTRDEVMNARHEAEAAVEAAKIEEEQRRAEFSTRLGVLQSAVDDAHSKLAQISAADGELTRLLQDDEAAILKVEGISILKQLSERKIGYLSAGLLTESHFAPKDEWPESRELDSIDREIAAINSRSDNKQAGSIPGFKVRGSLQALDARRPALVAALEKIEKHQAVINQVLALQSRLDANKQKQANLHDGKRSAALAATK